MITISEIEMNARLQFTHGEAMRLRIAIVRLIAALCGLFAAILNNTDDLGPIP